MSIKVLNRLMKRSCAYFYRAPEAAGPTGTAPFYGAGHYEVRLGNVLSQHSPHDLVTSTNDGRLILAEIEDPVARSLGDGQII